MPSLPPKISPSTDPLALAGLALSALVVALSSQPGLPAWAAAIAMLGLGAWCFLRPQPMLPQATGSRQDRRWAAGLLLWALALCLLRLDAYPPGPAFVESTMAVTTRMLDAQPYQPHVSTVQAPFPSLLFYQGLAAAKAWGWQLGALRVPAALWGALSVPLLYLLLRFFAAPQTAAAFALLYSVNNLFLCEARLFFPGSLLWFGALGSALLLGQGLRDGSWRRFALAGLCAGLCLHGYVPGRIVPWLLIAWLLSAWIPGAQGPRARAGQMLAFGAGLLLVAAPVLHWAWRHPDLYFYSVGRYGGGGALKALAQLPAVLPEYAAMLFRRADGILETTDGLSLYPVFHPDLLGAVALCLGLWACARAWRSPWPRLILIAFFGGILPAALAQDESHPNTRRALLFLPWAFAAGAWAWEGLRAAAPAWDAALRRALWGGVGLGALLSLAQYLGPLMGGPEMRDAYYHSARLIDRERAEHPSARVQASVDLVLPASHRLVFQPDKTLRRLSAYPNFAVLDERLGPLPEALKHFEDLLRPGEGGERLWLLSPYLYGAEPLLQALFPGGRARLHAEPRAPWPQDPRWDLQAPFVQLLRFYVPAAEADAYRGLVDLGRAPYARGARIDVFADGFGAAQRGHRLDLGGAWISDGGEASAVLAWPGWRVQVDGVELAPGRRLRLDPGAHRVRLQGVVPLGARGPLPLALALDAAALDAARSLAPLDPRYGFDAEARGADGRRRRRWELLPSHRFAQPEGVDLPAELHWRGRVRADEDGVHRFRLGPGFKGTLWVGGRRAAPGQSDGLVVDMRAGQALSLAMEGRFDEDPWHLQTAYLMVQAPGDEHWRALPYDWALAPDPWALPARAGRP